MMASFCTCAALASTVLASASDSAATDWDVEVGSRDDAETVVLSIATADVAADADAAG